MFMSRLNEWIEANYIVAVNLKLKEIGTLGLVHLFLNMEARHINNLLMQ